jgi:hypothetical protein
VAINEIQRLFSLLSGVVSHQHDPNLLTRNSLSSPIDVVIEENGDNGISPGYRMICQKDDRLPARRNLDRAGNDTLTGQLLPASRAIAFQGRARQPDPDPIAVVGHRPRRSGESGYVVEPVVSRATERMQNEGPGRPSWSWNEVLVGKCLRSWTDG